MGMFWCFWKVSLRRDRHVRHRPAYCDFRGTKLVSPGLLRYISCSREKLERKWTERGTVYRSRGWRPQRWTLLRTSCWSDSPEMESNCSRFLWKVSLGFANSIKFLVNFHFIDPGGLKLGEKAGAMVLGRSLNSNWNETQESFYDNSWS